MTLDEQIYAAAEKFLGVHEAPGPKSHPLIAEMFKLAPDWLDQNDSVTPWCGIFRGYVGHITATGVPTNHFRAASWANWGRAVPKNLPNLWRRGNTIVMSRPGGNHVAILSHVADGFAYCLGGNQSDSVNVTAFSLNKITHVRSAD